MLLELTQGDEDVPSVPGGAGEAPINDGLAAEELAGKQAGAKQNAGNEDDEPAPQGVDGRMHRINKLTAQRSKLREELSAKEQRIAELEAKTADIEGGGGPDVVISAAETAGVLPQFLDAKGAKAIAEAAKIERDLQYWEQMAANGEDFEFQGRIYTARDAARFAATRSAELRRVSGAAEAARHKAVERHNALLKLGQEAEKAGWKPGTKASTPATPSKASPPPLPGGGGERRAPSRTTDVPDIDWSKAETPEQLAELERQNVRRKLGQR
jgi:hypothetical protein